MIDRKVKLIFLILGIVVIFNILYPLYHGTRAGISVITTAMVVVASVWSYFNIRRDIELKKRIGLSGNSLMHIAGSVLIALILTIAFMLAFREEVTSAYLTSWQESYSWPVVIATMLFYIVLSVPLQEFIFRGYLQEALQLEIKNKWLGWLITSFLYGAVHLHYGFYFVMMAFAFGLLLGYIKIRTKNLYPPIAWHLAGGILLVLIFFALENFI